MKKNKENYFTMVFLKRSWWIILFLLFSFVSYERLIKSKNEEIFNYQQKLHNISKELTTKKSENKELKIMVNSLNDKDWIELLLIRELGIVPDGKLKVYFTSDN